MRKSRPVLWRVALIALLSALALVGMTGVASAHAQLEGSDPPSDDVVATAPKAITLTFDERVEPTANAIQVFDDHLHRVDDNRVVRSAAVGNRIQVGLGNSLKNGTYTVSWHVSSADTHPVAGTFHFSIGGPSQVTGTVPGTGRNNLAGVLLGVMRSIGYTGLILGPGVLLVTLALWPAGLATARTRRTLYLGLALLGISALGSMLLEGVWASGRPLSAMWSAPSSLDTHSRRFDTLYALRFYLLIAFGVLLVANLSAENRAASRAALRAATRPGRGKRQPVESEPWRIPRWLALGSAIASTLALLATWSLAGHAAAGLQSRLAVAADLAHVLAMTVWLGGLVMLTVSLRPAERVADLARVLPRFSRLAFAAVTVLVVSGTYQTWREVGSIDALRGTSFGRLLLVKLLGVVGLLVLGNLARRWVQRNLAVYRPWQLPRLMPQATAGSAASAATAGSAGSAGSTGSTLLLAPAVVLAPAPAVVPTGQYGPVELRSLRRGLTFELGLGLAVLALTAALVVSVPSRESYIRPFTQTLSAPGLRVALRIGAPRTGDSVLHLSVRDPGGKAIPVTALRGSLSQPAAALGPLPLRLARARGATGTGAQDVGLTFPEKGHWVLQLTVQTSSFDATSFTVPVDVS